MTAATGGTQPPGPPGPGQPAGHRGPADRVRTWPFFAWAVVGAGLCLALVTVWTIGIFVLPLVIAAVVGLLAWGGSRTIAAVGVVSGLGLVPLYLAFLNRGGPGDICSSSAGGQSCITEWSPWPWLIAGILLVCGGAILFAWLRHVTGPPATPPPARSGPRRRPPGRD
jgi:hypothetical protein